MYQKNMFDGHSCIKSFCSSKPLEKMLQNVEFLQYNNGMQKHESGMDFNKASSRAKTFLILMSVSFTSNHVIVDVVNFCDSPRMYICNVKKLSIKYVH